MFAGLTIETISKFSPIIAIIITLVTGAFMYICGQFINVVTTNALDGRFKDKSNQVKLKFWFYATGILLGTIFYLIYAIVLYQCLHGYLYSFALLLNVIVCFFMFIYFIITLLPIKLFQKIIKTKWHFILFLIHIISSVLMVASLSYEYLEKDNYLNFLWNTGTIAFLLSIFHFPMLIKSNSEKKQKFKYDIFPITEEEFKDIKNLKFDYQMDENRIVFYTGESEEKTSYIYDSSLKLYMKCIKLSGTDINTNQLKTSSTIETNNTGHVENNC
ncbi:MAG: hypothetical protein M3Z48_00655 [Lactobacillus sp.]|uniref:hypothetical protein n=1 Tax=Bacillus cereus TaxID=1396 RepID=UPI0007780541|nr:hypothetical protein [Bacillus cereus]MCT6901723.1 hypothetical protein [Lactobacillus sp.]MED3581341.1 hypothetical protein [Bacillus thuringiensis]UUE89896.1 hypothetical protein L2I54_04695 [Bacillus cereus]